MDALLELVLPYLTAPGRLWVQPGRAVRESAAGYEPVLVEWPAEAHHAVLQMCSVPWVCAPGVSVCALGESLVLQRAPAGVTLQDWVNAGHLSTMAADTLQAALTLGRNILLVGPWAACAELTGALLARAQAPCVVAGSGEACSAEWTRLSIDQLPAAGDRVAVFNADDLVSVMSRACGVVGWLSAHNIEQALMRYELLCGTAQASLNVIAGVDLVVSVHAGEARVRDIAEVRMGNDSYRLQRLFARGQAPVQQALTPMATPLFVDQLSAIGGSMLAEDLRHAVQSEVSVPYHERVFADGVPAPVAANAEADAALPMAPPVIQSPKLPRITSEHHLPPPGWELDQPLEELSVNVGISEEAPDAVAMTMAFGLGPPPRPLVHRGTKSRKG